VPLKVVNVFKGGWKTVLCMVAIFRYLILFMVWHSNNDWNSWYIVQLISFLYLILFMMGITYTSLSILMGFILTTGVLG